MSTRLQIKEAATHNLKNITVAFPLGKLSVVTGVSGAGKSSLLFDTIYAESYGRYMESLSSFARQYLQSLPKPRVAEILNLPPAIAVRQSRSGLTRRSTVGTLAELQDLLQVLFEYLSVVTCMGCAKVLVRWDHRDLADHLLAERGPYGESATLVILSPLHQWTGLSPEELQGYLRQQGFTRVFTRGAMLPLEEVKPRDLLQQLLVIDRLRLDPEEGTRLLSSLKLAFKLGKGEVAVQFLGEEQARRFSERNACLDCGISYPPPSQALFSFNHPHGACSQCQGFGLAAVADWRKIVPDRQSSLADEGLAPLNFGEHRRYYRKFLENAETIGLSHKRLFSDYTPAQWQWLQQGDGKKFLGMEGYFAWLASKKYKMHYRIHRFKFFSYATCSACEGKRFRREALAMTILGKNLADIQQLMIKDLLPWLELIAKAGENRGHDFAAHQRSVVSEAVEEAHNRLSYLNKIGLGYLSLSRSATTLSGGELQRLHLARCLASTLSETLYCLDEPSSGLHARDSKNLLTLLHNLRDQGNTVLVVEHERCFIEGADFVVELGPGPGELGGFLTYAGPPQLENKSRASTMLSGQRSLRDAVFLELVGASMHNLKNIAVRFPLKRFIAVCGVSGSGKTSLIQHTLYPLLADHLGVRGEEQEESQKEGLSAARLGPPAVLNSLGSVHLVSQAPLGRSSRSNIATYLAIYSSIRQLFAREEAAQLAGLRVGSFSFNVAGGRCETCKGLGTISEELSFLGEMAVECPRCQGKRFKPEVLGIRYNGLNLLEVLALTITQAREFFFAQRKIKEVLDQVIALGLGYITLGQHTSSFSGGEAQRLKLLGLLTENQKSRAMLFIFDEPTTGLSDGDVESLIQYLRAIVADGHTVIVVEHHLKVLRSCDYLIEIGPGAADEGGQLVFQGVPAQLSQVAESPTRPFMLQAF